VNQVIHDLQPLQQLTRSHSVVRRRLRSCFLIFDRDGRFWLAPTDDELIAVRLNFQPSEQSQDSRGNSPKGNQLPSSNLPLPSQRLPTIQLPDINIRKGNR